MSIATKSVFQNWADSPDGAAASPTIALGPGFWLLLLVTVLSAIGVGSTSLGALFGVFIGTGIGFFLSFIPVGGRFLFIGVSLLGSMLGGWVFLRGQARLQRLLAANEDSPPAPKDAPPAHEERLGILDPAPARLRSMRRRRRS